MPPPTLTVRRSAARGWGLVQFGLFPMAAGVFFTAMGFGGKEDRLLKYLPLVTFGGLGLLAVGIGLGMVADRSPKLSADGVGLVNHMSPGGGKLIPWGAIQSLDCCVDPFDSSGNMGRMILHLRSAGGEVTTDAIDLTGLEGGPLRVFTEVKRLWLQYGTPGGPADAAGGTTSA
jgi:hypothetical protein